MAVLLQLGLNVPLPALTMSQTRQHHHLLPTVLQRRREDWRQPEDVRNVCYIGRAEMAAFPFQDKITDLSASVCTTAMASA